MRRSLIALFTVAGLALGVAPTQQSWAAPADDVAADLAAVSIHNSDDVRGNIYLPATGANASTLTWTSSDPTVVSTTGVVNRPSAASVAKTVTMTVTATQGGVTESKNIPLTITPLPVAEPKTGYFFPYFLGESTTTDEELYFAASQRNDVKAWTVLNDGKSVLQSNVGEQGIRDPFIIRSKEGDRFFMIATDLNIKDVQKNFGAAQEKGSKNLLVWESDDLVNWSDVRAIKVASDYAGNVWAPEAYYDEQRGEYIVWWSSAIYASTDVTTHNIADSYQRMYYATTRDFVNFSEPQVWLDKKTGTGKGMIDATMALYKGMYYRIIKNEGYMAMQQDKSTDLRSTTYELIKDRVGVGQPNPWGGTYTMGEGPSLFPSNTDPDHWYLLQDQPSYHGGKGYMLFETNDLPSANWTSVLDGSLPPARHGSIIGVTQTELAALYAKYQPNKWATASAPVALTVQKGDTLQLPATVAATTAAGTQQLAVKWDAVDASKTQTVGTFDVKGTLDAGGTATATATVTVQDAPVAVESLSVTPDTAQIVVGKSTKLTASVTPLNATARAVTWTSSDTAVATVDATGTVIGRGVGTATITGTTADGKASDTAVITVITDGGPVIPSTAWLDSFESTTLDSHWSITNPVSAQWSLTSNPGSLTVKSMSGDTWTTANDYENVFMVDVPVGDFTAYTRLNETITANHHSAGIIAWQDEDNYVRTGLTYVSWADGGPRVLENAVETDAAYASTMTARPNSTGEWLKMQRTGDVIEMQYWQDGAWVTSSTETVGFQTTKVGLYAFAAGSAPSHTVTFDYFALETPSVTPEPTATVSATPTATTSPTVEPTVTTSPTVEPTVTTSPTQATTTPPVATVRPSWIYVPSGDLYSTPGTHEVNGRLWFTSCEPYSQTVRCRTDIWSSRIVYSGGKFVRQTGWVFNNWTYLPMMTREQWGANPYAHAGDWSDGVRKYRTVCDDPKVTGADACRTYIWGSYVKATQTSAGYSFSLMQGWVVNNIVRFRVA